MTDLVGNLANEIAEDLKVLLKDNPDKLDMLNWLKNEYSRYMMTSSDAYANAARLSIRDNIWVDVFECLLLHLGKYGSTQAVFRACFLLHDEFTHK
jgi:uncharacterized membrane protein YcgQ (UPF0703/DUF1980 family)